MATQQELLIKIRGDISDIQTKLNKVQKDVSKTEKSFANVKKAMLNIGKVGAAAIGSVAAATAGLVAIGAKYSGEVQQTEFLMGRLDATTQELISTKAKEAQAMGMTEKQYRDSAASLGTFMKSMGMTTEEANKLIPQMVQLAADGAAFANVPMDEAMAAISSAAMGNYEALGKLNIEMSDALINNSSYAQSLGKTTQEMTTAEKTQAIYNAMLERGTHLTGFAASESDSFSTQLALTKTKVSEAAGALGEKLLPLFTPLIKAIGDMADKLKQAVDFFVSAYDATGNFTEALAATADYMGLPWLGDFIMKLQEMRDFIAQIPEKLKEWEQPLTVAAIMVGTLAAAIGAYWVAQNLALISTAIGVAGITAWNAVAGVGTAITTAFGAAVAFLTSPITLVILAIGALIAIGYLLYKNWDEVSAYLKQTWESIKTAAINVWNSIKDFFSNLWNSIKEIATNVWNSIKTFFSNLWSGIKNAAINAWNAIKTGISNAWNGTINWVKNAANGMINFFKNLPSQMLNIGKNIIDGLLNGLKNAWNAVVGWISNAASWITDKFKSILGIHSPSREFMKIGMYVDEGLVKGLEDGEVDINSQITGMAEGLKTGFNSSFENPNSGGVAEVVGANTTINLNGSYMFQDKDSMDYFMNKLALAVQRG